MSNKAKGVTYIGAEMQLDGEMIVEGPASIAGKTKGVIRSTDTIDIEQGGLVEGELFCQEVKVSGEFKGKLHCDKLVIVSTGSVDGEVSSHHMEVFDGGQFIGTRTKGPEQGVLPTATAAKNQASTDQSSHVAAESTSAKTVTDSSSAKGQPSNGNSTKQAIAVSASQSSASTSSSDSTPTKSSMGKITLAIIAVLVIVAGVLYQSEFSPLTSTMQQKPQEPALFDATEQKAQMSDIERQAAMQTYKAQQANKASDNNPAPESVTAENIAALKQTLTAIEEQTQPASTEVAAIADDASTKQAMAEGAVADAAKATVDNTLEVAEEATTTTSAASDVVSEEVTNNISEGINDVSETVNAVNTNDDANNETPSEQGTSTEGL